MMRDLTFFHTWSSTGKHDPVQPNDAERWHSKAMPADEQRLPRFLTLADVAEILNTSVAQVRALVQSGELRYIQIGGRQQYRIETVELENYIQRLYAESDAKAGVTAPPAAPRER
jgi:excisionase family DNA binding protein